MIIVAHLVVWSIKYALTVTPTDFEIIVQGNDEFPLLSYEYFERALRLLVNANFETSAGNTTLNITGNEPSERTLVCEVERWFAQQEKNSSFFCLKRIRKSGDRWLNFLALGILDHRRILKSLPKIRSVETRCSTRAAVVQVPLIGLLVHVQ
jgi:hypothetical protein